jgi:DNA-binding PadR family transcriptional regulator
MGMEELDRLERSLLVHLLDHRGQQVRFEADQWTTEFGIFRAFGDVDQGSLKIALRALEMGRFIYRRVQYVIGYSEPKLVYSLTPSGHRKAVDIRRETDGESVPAVTGSLAEPDPAPFAAPYRDG